MFFRAEQSDQCDQHDGHRHQADHQDGQEDHAVHRHVPRGPGNQIILQKNFSINITFST